VLFGQIVDCGSGNPGSSDTIPVFVVSFGDPDPEFSSPGPDPILIVGI
jgi:hypothetical protein